MIKNATERDISIVAAKLGISKTVARLSLASACDDVEINAQSLHRPPVIVKGALQEVKVGRRVRQDTKPLMNKLESEWFEVLKRDYPGEVIRPQAKRFRLAAGAWYKPDFTAVLEYREPGSVDVRCYSEVAWECKGPRQMKGVARGTLAIKAAAGQYPEVRWVLVWKECGQWRQQEVLP